jgi:hypothetical protein
MIYYHFRSRCGLFQALIYHVNITHQDFIRCWSEFFNCIFFPDIKRSLRKIQRKFRHKPFDPKSPNFQRTKAISTTLNLTPEQLARMRSLGIIRQSQITPKKGVEKPAVTHQKEMIITVPEPVEEEDDEEAEQEPEAETEPEPESESQTEPEVYQEQNEEPDQIKLFDQMSFVPSYSFTPQLDASTGILMDYSEFLHKEDRGTIMLPPNFDEDMTEIICNTNEETYGDIDLNCDQGMCL